MRRSFFQRVTGVALLASLPLVGALSGCGYTEQEWLVQTDKYQRVVAKERANEEKLDAQSAELDTQRARVGELEDHLRSMGVDLEAKDTAVNDLTTTLADREKAIAQYKLRAKQLEGIRVRFEALRARLDALSNLGIEVHIRRNRMVISLPGDVLFDTNKDKVKKEGKDILAKVAQVIHDDPLLETRDYQVAGNTDSKALKGGNFGDNWGLSLMRARQVLLFMIDPADGKLNPAHWSAAGYADTDPVATNDSDEGRQKNRRCDLVLVPSLEEMLDLRALAAEELPLRPRGPVEPRGELELPGDPSKTPAATKPAPKKAAPKDAAPATKSAKKPASKQ